MDAIEDKVNPYRTRILRYPHKILINSDDPPAPESIAKAQAILSSYTGIVCELGSGSGAHLIERARKEPSVAFVGIELRYKRTVRTIEKAEGKEVHNVFVLRTKAQYLPLLFPHGSLKGIYMNFPDPWEKKSDRKHRMFSDQFLLNAKSLLVKGGFISFKTDHREYWENACAISALHSEFECVVREPDLHTSPWAEENVLTEFVKLFLSQALPIHHLKLILNSSC